jgi:hypothetical protein
VSTELITLPDNLPVDRLEEINAEVKTAVAAVLVSMGVVDLAPEFKTRRDAIVARAGAIRQVQSKEEEAAAAAVRKELSGLESEMEGQKKSLKGVLDAAGKRILALQREGIAPAEKAKQRLTDMLAGYAQELIDAQRKAEEEQRKRGEAARAEAEKLEREAEKLRKLSEQADQAGDKKSAEHIAQMQQEMADAAELAALVPVTTAPAIQHAPGTYHREIWDYEILGSGPIQKEMSLVQLVKQGFFFYVKLEERRSTILDALKSNPKMFDGVEGIRVFQTARIYGR